MPKKYFLFVVLAVLVVAVLLMFVYQQFQVQSPAVNTSPSSLAPPAEREAKQKTPEPETIDDISRSIQEESLLDLSALDEEEAGEIEDITKDSESINNLGTSYDENSF